MGLKDQYILFTGERELTYHDVTQQLHYVDDAMTSFPVVTGLALFH
jgi:hypothetical protein